jgi:hypothetical protein
MHETHKKTKRKKRDEGGEQKITMFLSLRNRYAANKNIVKVLVGLKNQCA